MIVDTTVQPKNVMFPTDAKLLNQAREKLVRLARLTGVGLRQHYARVGKFALIKRQRYAYAKQFKRARRALKTLRTYLGATSAARSRATPRSRAGFRSCYCWRAASTSSGKASAGRRSIRCMRRRSNALARARLIALTAGNPYDGHTLQTIIPDMEKLVGNIIERLLLDKGYRGHNAAPDYKFRVFTSGQKQGVTPSIKRTMRRRSAIEPVIDHLKAEHRMERNYLWFKHGDANNAVLAAVGYNFRRLLRWLRRLLHQILVAFFIRSLLNPT